MAALRKEAPAKSFFSGSSHTFKKLVNVFPIAQKQSNHSSQQQQQQQQRNLQKQQHQQKPAVACEGEEGDDEDEDGDDAAEFDVNDGYCDEVAHISGSSAAEEHGADLDNGLDDDTEYSGSSEGEYPRPRIREDLLPHDFSAWQKSPSLAPYPHSEASSTSREAETFSEVLSSSTSQDRHPYSQNKCTVQGRHPGTNNHVKYHSKPSHIEYQRNPSDIEPRRNPSPTLTSAMASSPTTDLHLHQVRQNLPDLKLEIAAHGVSGVCRYGGPTGLKGLPEDDWSVCNGASENGRRNSVDGSCWQRRKVPDPVMLGGRVRDLIQDGSPFYQNLVEMVPRIEMYREYQEDGHQRGNFQHHASMVYTRAPSREALAKKVADSVNSRRASRNTRRVKKKSDAMWEEQENLPRRVKANDLSCSPRRVSYENSVDIAKLQGQVEELQRKLVVREGALQSFHCVAEPKDESSEVLVLMRRVEELQRNASEKDQMLELAKETLVQKENDIQAMQRLLQDTEETCVGLRARNANSEEEVRVLRCEVAALRWQMEIDAERTRSETEASVDGYDTTCQRSDRRKHEEELEVCELEAVRKMYLTSLVVARHVPREECLVLVGVLRIQLQHMLRIPTFHLP